MKSIDQMAEAVPDPSIPPEIHHPETDILLQMMRSARRKKAAGTTGNRNRHRCRYRKRKLSPEQQKAIADEYRSGQRFQRQLAEDYGVSTSTVRRILQEQLSRKEMKQIAAFNQYQK